MIIYCKLIHAFFELTSVLMILIVSLNHKGAIAEPPVQVIQMMPASYGHG